MRELKCHIVTTVSKESGSPLYGVQELKSILVPAKSNNPSSRTHHGARELKLTDYAIGGLDHCRTLYGCVSWNDFSRAVPKVNAGRASRGLRELK